MSECKHTPGPWYAQAAGSGETIWIGTNDVNVGCVPGYADHPLNAANARLMASSPDLKAFAESIKIYTVEGDDDHLHVKINDRVVTVIPTRSPGAALWLDLEAQRKAVLAKANGGA